MEIAFFFLRKMRADYEEKISSLHSRGRGGRNALGADELRRRENRIVRQFDSVVSNIGPCVGIVIRERDGRATEPESSEIDSSDERRVETKDSVHLYADFFLWLQP